MENKNLLEAQFWWAFSCLAVEGRRNEDDFRAEVLRRSSGFYPDSVEVNSIVKEARCHLPSVLNHAKTGNVTTRRALNGWERHVLALSTHPGDRRSAGARSGTAFFVKISTK